MYHFSRRWTCVRMFFWVGFRLVLLERTSRKPVVQPQWMWKQQLGNNVRWLRYLNPQQSFSNGNYLKTFPTCERSVTQLLFSSSACPKGFLASSCPPLAQLVPCVQESFNYINEFYCKDDIKKQKQHDEREPGGEGKIKFIFGSY